MSYVVKVNQKTRELQLHRSECFDYRYDRDYKNPWTGEWSPVFDTVEEAFEYIETEVAKLPAWTFHDAPCPRCSRLTYEWLKSVASPR